MKLRLLVVALASISTIATAAETPAWRSSNPVPAGAKLTTVRADLARPIGTWTGVRSCNNIERSAQPFRRAFAKWLGSQVLAHPRQSLGRFGYARGTVWFENRTTNNRRSCKAGFTHAKVYAEFY